MFRLASRVGFSPPYFYHPRLAERLSRYRGPALLVTGAEDGFVPPAHARLYATRLAGAQLHVVADAGNSVILEQAAQAAELLKHLVQG